MPFITEPTVSKTFLARIKQSPHLVGFKYKPTHTQNGSVDAWKSVTYSEFFERTSGIAAGIKRLGVRPGDRVSILSNTRFEWSLADIAILGVRGVTVPIYASNSEADVKYILNHCEATVAFLENSKQVRKVVDILSEDSNALPHLKKIICFDPSTPKDFPNLDLLITLSQLEEMGRTAATQDPGFFEKSLLAATPDELLTICYTSGTTGIPKGVMLTHDSMMSVLEDCRELLAPHIEADKETVLSFLPCSHILGKVECAANYTFGWTQYFAESFDTLNVNLDEARPTLMFGVPRVFEKAAARIQSMVANGPEKKQKIFAAAMAVGRKYAEAKWKGESPSIATRLKYQVAKRVVFKKISDRFGGRLRYAICGGAPLPKEIGEFFYICGITILEGYGLTETCAPIAVNLPAKPKYGAVGPLMPEVTVKISEEDGEILVKSRKVFKGYYKMPEETAQVMRGGWFQTGDIGQIDSDGYLRITDRKKDLIITSGGKNVAPQKIENLAKNKRFISQFVVVGDRRQYLTALVTLDRDEVIKYASESDILFSEYSELVKNPQIQALVQRTIDEVNSHLASYESIKRFTILPDEFAVESGELTPSLKVKRRFVSEKFRSELENMYA